MQDPFDIAQALLASRPQAGEDRLLVLRQPGPLVLAVADGAGGMSGGAEAAEQALGEIVASAGTSGLRSAAAWTAAIARADAAVASRRGQCALAGASVVDGQIVGASVGDCGAWLIGAHGIVELTIGQVRKPLVGSGEAAPVAFEASLRGSTLLLASDGLLKYAPRAAIATAARQDDLQAAAAHLGEMPRLRSGTLPDDVAVLLCRLRE